uniref:NRAMP family divalent metal transporter n=1 Tax=Parerythrobacter lutipelagi TaxID=1964208 RepID=UPI0010F6A89F|nr:divalent metal cation transporter [Parerythrobacter lutipelagi]
MINSHYWRTLGPGLLFSGAAVGVSHLVQSTRAGALFGLALAGVIVLINILKYPAFRFGVDYGHAKQRSLLAGYRELGLWAPVLFLCVIVPVTPIVVAAISATTAGLIGALTGVGLSVPLLAALVIGGTSALIIVGGYSWLDAVNRLLMAFLILATVATTVLVLPRVEWGTLTSIGWAADPKALLFLVALAGFMPNPLDVSVPQSIWTIEAENRVRDSAPVTLHEARLGFTSGYVLSAVLALCFCIMGAGVLHAGSVQPASDAVGFATQIVGLYRETLGPVPATLAAISALAVMLTTMFAAFDAYGRAFASAYEEITDQRDPARLRKVYMLIVIAVALSALSAVFFLLSDFGAFIDLATSIAFLSAPVIAALNHLVMIRCDLPDEARPSRRIRLLSLVAIATMSALALSYFLL